MAKEAKKDPQELTVEQKLKALFQLQTMLSKIDEIKQASLLSEIKRTGWTVEGMLQWLSGNSDNPVSNLKDITLSQYVGVMQRLEHKPDAAAGA